MKTLKTLIGMVGILLFSLSFYSCLNDDNDYYDNLSWGIVTVKPLSDTSYYLQLDDSTTLQPVGNYIPYFGLEKERRALLSFTFLNDPVEGYDHAIQVIRIDSILTKTIVDDLGEQNDEVYGNDPVQLATYPWSAEGIWIEDGYLNIHFFSYFGNTKPHLLNLVRTHDAASSYELEFRHNAYDDPKISEGQGLVAFRLNSLPDTNGQTVKLKIKYKSFEGDKVVELDYNSAKPVATSKRPSLHAEDLQTIK